MVFATLVMSAVVAFCPERAAVDARYVPERMDDFFFENEFAAFRVYGPKLARPKPEGQGFSSNGIDVFNKGVKDVCGVETVLDSMKARKSYHADNGRCFDPYTVGPGSGCGGLRICVASGEWLPHGNWKSQRVVEKTPGRAVFELEYETYTMRGTVTADSPFIRFDVTPKAGAKPGTAWGPGLDVAVSRGHEGVQLVDLGRRALANAEKASGTYTAVVVDPSAGAVKLASDVSDSLCLLVAEKPFTYYIAAAWRGKGDFPDAESWFARVRAFADSLAAATPPEGPVRLEKAGTIDIYITEANPIVFKGKPWLMEYIRCRKNGKRYRHNTLGTSYFRFRDLTNLNRFSPPFGKGLHMGNAFVHDGRIVVTAVEDWGKPRFYQMESDDMEHWTEPRVILENPEWAGYNTTMCRAGDRFVLSFELGLPKSIVGTKFTMFFAESKDLKDWKLVDGAAMGRAYYTGAPMLRWHGGWFYYFHLRSEKDGYRTRVCRSRDLVNWEQSPHIVLDYCPSEDRKLHPGVAFTDAERAEIAGAVDRNASDLDVCEFDGGLIGCYSWGDQRGNEFLSLVRANCTEREFCESFFK